MIVKMDTYVLLDLYTQPVSTPNCVLKEVIVQQELKPPAQVEPITHKEVLPLL